MKNLSYSETLSVNGGFGNFLGGAFAGWALGKFAFDPISEEFIRNAEKQIPNTLDTINNSIRDNGFVGRYDLN